MRIIFNKLLKLVAQSSYLAIWIAVGCTPSTTVSLSTGLLCADH